MNFVVPYIGNNKLPFDELIFQRGRYTTDQIYTCIEIETNRDKPMDGMGLVSQCFPASNPIIPARQEEKTSASSTLHSVDERQHFIIFHQHCQ